MLKDLRGWQNGAICSYDMSRDSKSILKQEQTNQKSALLAWDALDPGLDHDLFRAANNDSVILAYQVESIDLPFVAHSLHCLPWRPYEDKSRFRTFSSKR